MPWVLYVVYSIALFIVLYWLNEKYQFFPDTGVILLMWSIKIITGVLLTVIYTYHYTDHEKNDIYKYFRDGEKIYAILHENPWHYLRIITGIRNDTREFTKKYYSRLDWWDRKYSTDLFNDSHLIIRFNAVARIFSGGSIYIHTLFANFLAFLGSLLMIQTFCSVFYFHPLSVWPFFLWPSTLFWTSGLLKESFVMLGMGMVISSYFSISRANMKVILSLLGLLIIYYSKFYIAIVFVILVILLWVMNEYMLSLKDFSIVLLSLIALMFLAGSIVAYMIGMDTVVDFIIAQRNDFVQLAIDTQAASTLDLVRFESWTDVMMYIPRALYHAALLPFIWHTGSFLITLSAVENVVFMIFILVLFKIAYQGFMFMRKHYSTYWIGGWASVFIFSFLFCLIMWFIIGLTTPVLGAIVRYRSIATPFLLMSITQYMLKNPLRRSES